MTREEIEAALAILDRPAVGIAPSYWTSRLPESVTEQALRALLRALPVLEAAREHAQTMSGSWEEPTGGEDERMLTFHRYGPCCDVCLAIREYDRQEEKPCE